MHLLAAFDPGTAVVLGQARVDTKSNEITAFGPLLDRLAVAGAIVTADALHTQRGHADYLIGRGAHYLLTVKANQPRLLARLRQLPWAQMPVADQTSGKAHGRVESPHRQDHLRRRRVGLSPRPAWRSKSSAAADPQPAAAGTAKPSTR